MSFIPTSVGEVAFDAPGAGKPCKTAYKIVGSLEQGESPLIVLHGGPGGGHEYLSPMADLHKNFNIPVIFYDQIGCGESTRLRKKMGDDSFWTFELFIKELDNLVTHLKLREHGFYILGQSWGGMLGSAFASEHPSGLKKLIMANTPASMPLYEICCQRWRDELPPDVRDVLVECDKKGDYESEEFEKAAEVFYKRHICRLDPMPQDVQQAFMHLKSDPTSYMTMQGPSEFTITGAAFKGWEGFKYAGKIETPTLLINGQYDSVHDLCVEPWFEKIPKVRWVSLSDASHMSHWEQREQFVRLVGRFVSGPAL